MANENAERFNVASSVICGEINKGLLNLPASVKSQATEIRLRVNKPLTVCCGNNKIYVFSDGLFSERASDNRILTVNQKNLLDTFQKLCGYSVYSYQRQIRNGYITIKGGHRAGICGTAITDGSSITGMRDITSINIRISKEIKNSAMELYNKIGKEISGTLIAGAPSCGKTTVLRDLARRISLDGKNVTVIDERGELSGAWNGTVANDLGYCDVLNGFPKNIGIMNALRSMSPDVIICDEIGTENDCIAIEEAINAGVIIISTVHADSLDGLASRPQGKRLIKTGAFKHIVMLKGKNEPGKIQGIYTPKDTF